VETDGGGHHLAIKYGKIEFHQIDGEDTKNKPGSHFKTSLEFILRSFVQKRLAQWSEKS